MTTHNTEETNEQEIYSIEDIRQRFNTILIDGRKKNEDAEGVSLSEVMRETGISKFALSRFRHGKPLSTSYMLKLLAYLGLLKTKED